MSTTPLRFLCCVPFLTGMLYPFSSKDAMDPQQAFRQLRAQAPLAFEANQGQAAANVQFLVRAHGFALFLTSHEMVSSRGDFRMHLAGSAPFIWQGRHALPGITNYFRGNDPSHWITRVRNYSAVRALRIYPGIDMRLRGDDHRLEYEFAIAPEADPGRIRLNFGAAQTSLDPNGSLVVRTALGTYIHRAPRAFQSVYAKTRTVAVSFQIDDRGEVTFQLGPYNRALPLTIDPVLSYHSFLGGSATETATAVSAADNGSLYFTGWSDSIDFPLAGSPFKDVNKGMRDAFVTKLYPNGGHIYATYIGGSQNDQGAAIAHDSEGYVFITGSTFSPDFPLSGAFQQTYGGNGDAFVVKLNTEGSNLAFSSYLGGSAADRGEGIASDALGYATAVGYTASSNLPVRNARQASFGGVEDMFLFKLHANSSVLYSTYFGGAGAERAQAIALDAGGDAYVAGQANCASLPTTALIGAVEGIDAFVLKWRGAGDGAAYLSCIGGNNIDSASGIAVDAAGSAYVTGYTSSSNFPVALAFQSSYAGTQNGSLGDAFLLKLNPAGSALAYSSFLGGSRDDWGQSVALDSFGSAFVAGITYSANFPTPAGTPALTAGVRSGFLARVSPSGAALQQTFFLEGINEEDRYATALDPKGGVYIVGGAAAGIKIPRPSSPPLRAFVGPVSDALVAKLSTARLQVQQDTYPATVPPSSDFSFVQRVVNRGPDDAENVSFRGLLPPGMTLLSCAASTGTCLNDGGSFQVDVPVLSAGRGVEVTLSARLGSGASETFVVTSTALSGTLDPSLADNFLAVAFFTSPGTACVYTLSPPSLTVGPAGGFFGVNVSTGSGCPWTGTSASDWITPVSSGASSGTGIFTVSVSPNLNAAPRAGSITVAGQRVVFQQGATSASPAIPPFSDVPSTDPFFSYIQLLRSLGITSGCTVTQYCPNDPTTRGQMAVFIVRSVLGSDDFSFPSTPFFNDVPPGHPQFRHIQKLRELGITAGCNTVSYCPDHLVTRSQMASFLIRGRLAISAAQTFAYPTAFSFLDVPPSYPTYPAIQKMKELGITTGCSITSYCPEDFTTRGQMAAFLVRAFLAP
ncbi:MAG TPA: SBBP repeat-containing protein [Bryobacteraceae bacterium]|nr:SBBP repeat-containing protein [Bryobacteraceae bacterium]